MGAVYLGTQLSLSRKVAVKMLPGGIEVEDPGYAIRFRNEARLMARVSHPAIVGVIDFGSTDEGLLYFIMEHVDGMDILQMMRASPGRRLPAEHARDIACHVCDALAHAHGKGVIHRDIKPANVLIDHDGRVKVADFGLAKWSAPGFDPRLTFTGAAVGTPGYIAPEALVEGAELDGRADLYAVGAMLFQMLTGRPPQGWLKSPSGEVPGLSPRFDAILRRALEPDPAERYQTAGELHADLIAACEGVPESSVDADAATIRMARAPLGGPRQSGSHPRGFWKWIALILAIGLAAGWWILLPERETGDPPLEPAAAVPDLPANLTPPKRRVEADPGIDAPPLAAPPRRVEE